MSGGVANVGLGLIDVVRDDRYLGVVRKFMDKNHADKNSNLLLSGASIYAAYVKNGSGVTLAAGTGIKFLNTALGKTIGAKHGADERCDGVVDPFISSAGLANGSYGWIIIGGPCDVLAGYGGLAQGDVVQTAADGTFITLTDNNTYAIGRSGVADEAADADALGRVWLHLRESILLPC